jgi:hypothetical protein
MCESWRHPKLFVIVLRQLNANPLSKRSRRPPKVHRYVKHLTFDYANQLSLRLLDLVMQPAQHTFDRTGVVVLYKLHVLADRFVESDC